MPRPFERAITGHEVSHTSRLKWGHLENGQLLNAAEESGFSAIITVDQNIPYQQNIAGRGLGLIIIRSTSNSIADFLAVVPAVLTALETLEKGTVLTIPDSRLR